MRLGFCMIKHKGETRGIWPLRFHKAPAPLPDLHKCHMEVSMIASIHRLIESALELDQTLSLDDRETILACCRSPAKFRERARGPEERLLSQRQVCEMLGVSRATLWRMCQAGLRPVVLFHGNKRFRKSDILSLMSGHGVVPER